MHSRLTDTHAWPQHNRARRHWQPVRALDLVLYSLYSRDALTTTPSSRSTGTACVTCMYAPIYHIVCPHTRYHIVRDGGHKGPYAPRHLGTTRLTAPACDLAHAQAHQGFFLSSGDPKLGRFPPALACPPLAVHACARLLGQPTTGHPAVHGSIERTPDLRLAAHCTTHHSWLEDLTTPS